MILDADKLEMGIDMLSDYLSRDVMVVSFTKKDGTERVMRCTQNMDLIPVEFHPTPKLPTDLQEDSDPQLFKVFDLDKKGWRSFRYTTIKSLIAFTNQKK
jgi:hypothetical protein